MTNSDPPDPEWEKTRKLLREHLVAPALEHPDFVNSRVLEAVDRMDRRAGARPLFSLRGFAWAGVGALAAAAVLAAVFLPREFPLRHDAEFISQVINARAGKPQLSVTSFSAPGERGVVLWIDGADFIPSDQTVR